MTVFIDVQLIYFSMKWTLNWKILGYSPKLSEYLVLGELTPNSVLLFCFGIIRISLHCILFGSQYDWFLAPFFLAAQLCDFYIFHISPRCIRSGGHRLSSDYSVSDHSISCLFSTLTISKCRVLTFTITSVITAGQVIIALVMQTGLYIWDNNFDSAHARFSINSANASSITS